MRVCVPFPVALGDRMGSDVDPVVVLVFQHLDSLWSNKGWGDVHRTMGIDSKGLRFWMVQLIWFLSGTQESMGYLLGRL